MKAPLLSAVARAMLGSALSRSMHPDRERLT
jgi:hypothetical protein